MWRWAKRGLLALLGLVVVLVAVVLVNTLRYAPTPVIDAPTESRDVDIKRAAANLSRAIQFKTVTARPVAREFSGFRAWLSEAYPRVHGTMARRVIGGGTLLYKWTGKDVSAKPILLTGHYDVVPVQRSAHRPWAHKPYAGVIDKQFVWGRGALDDKGAIIAMLEAAEDLIAKGFQPKQTIYFSFGHDEEIGGKGAKAVVEHLKRQNVRFAWSLDEGSFVLDGIVPGLAHPVASINVAEKGYVTLVVTAKGEGGHSSLPPKNTAVGRLAKAIDKLQTNPVPGGLTGLSAEFFDNVGRNFSFERRLLFANRWLFGALIENILSQSGPTNAMLRTTTAPTMLSGSIKENVLPTEARAVVNFRIHPRDTIDSVLAHVRRVIDDDQVSVRISKRSGIGEATPVSSHTADGYKLIADSFRDVFSPVIVIPGLTIAATDTRHYGEISDDSYRIIPFTIDKRDIPRIHGSNERLSLDNLKRGIVLFKVLIERI